MGKHLFWWGNLLGKGTKNLALRVHHHLAPWHEWGTEKDLRVLRVQVY